MKDSITMTNEEMDDIRDFLEEEEEMYLSLQEPSADREAKLRHRIEMETDEDRKREYRWKLDDCIKADQAVKARLHSIELLEELMDLLEGEE